MKRRMRSYLLPSALLVAGFIGMTSEAQASISVGPTGTGTITFDTLPAATEWSTMKVDGSDSDATTPGVLDAWIIANMSAASVTTVLPTDAGGGGSPLGANNLARFNSGGQWLQTSPTGVKCNVLMATLKNDSGGSLAGLSVSYDLLLDYTNIFTLAEEIPGHRVYYSSTGTPGSWTLATALSAPAITFPTANRQVVAVSGTLSLGAWASGALLYILWVDDNAAASRRTSGTPPNTTEAAYMIDNWRAFGVKKDVAFQQGVDGYTGAVDTEIAQGYPDNDYSSYAVLSCDGSDSGEDHNLIRFNNLFGPGPGQVPLGQTILKATLTLNIEDEGGLVNLHRMNKDWTASVTWNTFDPVSYDGVLSGTYVERYVDDTEAVFAPDASFTASAVGPIVIDLPVATIQAWADGTATNYGWALLPTTTDGVDWSSSDTATVSARPKLAITWGQVGDAVVEGITATPRGFTIRITDGGGPGAVNTNTIVVKLDNVDITSACAISQVGGKITVAYTAPALLASASAHVASIAYNDSSTPPKAQSADLPFTVPTYATIPASYAMTASDIATSKPGFVWRVYQNAANTANNNQRPLDQLNGKLIDPATGLPYVNGADPTIQGEALAPAVPADPEWAPLKFEILTFIDLNAADGGSSGYFTPDLKMPGLPSALSGIAGEVITYLELPEGFLTMGGYSDDGFRVTAVAPWVDPWALQGGIMLGEYAGGAGEATFSFAVTKAGIYPIRTVWEQGGGSAYLEWFSVKGDGTKVRINDTANGGWRAYRETQSPCVQKCDPAPGAVDVPLTNAISIALADGAASKIKNSSIQLWLNGVKVTPTINKPPGTNVTTVRYVPPANLVPEETYTVHLVFGDDATPANARTAQYQFTAVPSLVPLALIDDATIWSYNDSGTDLGTSWKEKSYPAESSWATGAACIGNETSKDADNIMAGSGAKLRTDLSGTYVRSTITYYFRRHFNYSGPAGVRLRLRHVVDDGAVFYVNGAEVHRFGWAAGVVFNYQTIFADHENAWAGPFTITSASPVAGDNVLAGEAHQEGIDSSDIVFGAELYAITSQTPRPKIINPSLESGGLSIGWSGAGTLEQADAVTGPWNPAPSQSNPQIVPATAPAKFYRIKQ